MVPFKFIIYGDIFFLLFRTIVGSLFVAGLNAILPFKPLNTSHKRLIETTPNLQIVFKISISF